MSVIKCLGGCSLKKRGLFCAQLGGGLSKNKKINKCTHVTVTSNGEGGSAAGFRPAGEVAEKETGGGKDWASLWKVFSSNQKNEANLPNCWKIYKTL